MNSGCSSKDRYALAAVSSGSIAPFLLKTVGDFSLQSIDRRVICMGHGESDVFWPKQVGRRQLRGEEPGYHIPSLHMVWAGELQNMATVETTSSIVGYIRWPSPPSLQSIPPHSCPPHTLIYNTPKYNRAEYYIPLRTIYIYTYITTHIHYE